MTPGRHIKQTPVPTGRAITVLYVIVAFAGAGGIIALRWFGFHSLLTAGFGSGLVVLYAGLAILLKPRALSTGAIGDNCYYLGFIFTLASLAWSLYAVGDRQGDSEFFVLEIVSGFGIALLTTAVGVIMRVALNPPRVDLIEQEQAAFQSIRHYYELMHRDLASLTATNKQFSLGIKLSLDEFRRGFQDDLRGEAEARRKAIAEIVGNAEERLITRLAELEARATRQVETAGANLEKTATGATNRAVDKVETAAETRIADALSRLSNQMSDAADATIKTQTELKDVLQKLSTSSTDLVAAAEKTRTQVPRQVANITEAVTVSLTSINTALDELDRAGQQISDRMMHLSQRVTEMEDRADHRGRGWPGLRWLQGRGR